MSEISDFLKHRTDKSPEHYNILEFGSGNGYQIPYLKKLGKVTASDVYLSDKLKEINKNSEFDFVKCSITDTPFSNEQFNLIYSNHVLEHIEDPGSAFKELMRIGKEDCIYAFCVPTNIWLLLYFPAHYYIMARGLFEELFLKSKSDRSNNHNPFSQKSLLSKIICKIFPGHGKYNNFFRCYSFFRVKNWKNLFQNNGFRVLKTKHLLLYAASEWPIIPVTRTLTDFGVCSSVLFILKKK